MHYDALDVKMNCFQRAPVLSKSLTNSIAIHLAFLLLPVSLGCEPGTKVSMVSHSTTAALVSATTAVILAPFFAFLFRVPRGVAGKSPSVVDIPDIVDLGYQDIRPDDRRVVVGRTKERRLNGTMDSICVESSALQGLHRTRSNEGKRPLPLSATWTVSIPRRRQVLREQRLQGVSELFECRPTRFQLRNEG